jgi:hypothetical protein
MMVRQIVIRLGLAVAGLALIVGAGAGAAQARVFVTFGVPFYPYYAPPPVYYSPPVYYAPPPVYYAPPTYAQPTYGQPAPQSWYYCYNPPGYYPSVPNCPDGWRQVPATR